MANLRFVQIQTHSGCNANCVFCPYVESWHHDHPGTMSDALFDAILEDLAPFADSLSTGKICPYLMNEPLMDKTLFDKIRRIQAAFPKTVIELSTNAILLDDAKIDELIDVLAGRPHELWISHHGIDAATLEHAMGVPYAKVHDNTIHLLRRSMGRLNVTLYGVGASRCGLFEWFDEPSLLVYWLEQFAKHGFEATNVNVMFAKAHDRAGGLRRMERGAASFRGGHVRDIGLGHPPFGCPRLDQWLHVMYDGTIRLCCQDYHAEVPLPNLAEMSIVDYLQSDAYHDLGDRVTGRIESPPDFICKRCTQP